VADEPKQGAKKLSSVGCGSVLAVMAASVAFGLWLSLSGIHLPSPLRLFVLMLAAFTLALPVHEAGHVIAGLLVGFRCYEASVPPLRIYRSAGGWRIGVAHTMRGAYAACYFAGGRNLRKRLLLYSAGGCLISLLSGMAAGVCAALSKGLAPEWFRCALIVYAGVSMLMGILASLPVAGGSWPSDGVRMRLLWRDGPAAARSCSLDSLTGATMRGVRPKDLDPELLRIASSLPDGSIEDLSAARHCYNCAVDSGRIEEAGELLAEIVEGRQQLPDERRPVWLCEAAWFEAAFRQDAAAARKWMEHPENRVSRASAGARLKAQAAIAALEGRFGEAEKLAQQALRELDRGPDLGMVRSIRETLVRVTARPPDPAAAV
jgi:hypothetical protein